MPELVPYMVHVYVARCDKISFSSISQKFRGYLPQSCINKAACYRFEEDARRYLLGKVLLVRGMQDLGRPDFSLEQLQTDQFSKPYVAGEINFNITHSGNYVLCAFLRNYRIGIDVEEIKPVTLRDYSNYFTSNEWEAIYGSGQPLQKFYYFWTRKEAVIKADGRGLQFPLLSFDVTRDRVMIGPCSWYLTGLRIADAYIAHLATDVNIRESSFHQII